MDHQGIHKTRPSLLVGLVLALLFGLLNSTPSLAADAKKWDGSSYVMVRVPANSQITTRPLLSFSPPDITFTYGMNTNDASLNIFNLGDETAKDVYLYVDFGAISVATSSASYTSGATPYFELPDIPAAASYTLTFTLAYSNWCASSAIDRTLVWQPQYQDAKGNQFTSGAEISSIPPVSGAPGLQVSLSGAPDIVHDNSQFTYNVTSAYSGAANCGNGAMGAVAVVDTVPAGFDVVDAGGGTWVPGAGGTGGTITWNYTQPASLNTSITLGTISSPSCGATFTNAVTATCTDCAGAAAPATAAQTSFMTCGNQAAAQKTVAPVVCERCGEYQYTNTYTFVGDVSAGLSSLTFAELAEHQQQFISGSFAANFDGADITGCPTLTDTTPGGALLLDFSGCAGSSIANKTLTLTYRLRVTTATATACENLSFFSRSDLTLPGQTIYSAALVQVQAPAMTLSMSGLPPGIDKGETNPVTITITSTSTTANPRDARFVLSGENYAVNNPAAVSCSGSVVPTSCTPTIIGNDYVWTFADDFNGSGKMATLELVIQKRATEGINLDGHIFYDDQCNDDGTSDNSCSTSASIAPAVQFSGDLAIEVSPAINPTAGKYVQWKTYVINRGSGVAYNVWVDHALGAGLEYSSSTVDNPAGVTIVASQDHSGGGLNGASTLISSMAPGERREITLNAIRVSQSGLTYSATTSWGFLGLDAQTPDSSSSSVSIQPLVVINANDSGPGSLRQAVADAVAADTILFNGDYTIQLASQLSISKELTIDGGSHTITLSGDSDGDGNGNVRVISINSSGVVTLKQLNIARGAISGDTGGGIYNEGTLTVENSTFSGNSALYGGGIANFGSLTILNSTFSGNSAFQGGGIINNSTLTVQNSTFSGNSALDTAGGGIINFSKLNLSNTIIANSPTGGDCRNVSGDAINADHNLVEATASDACGLTDGSDGNMVGADPLLGALGTYGGKTQTFALLPGSPAVDAGENCLAADQRGVSRPQPAGGACDIGAFEWVPSRTVTFDANLGSGSMATQTANFSTALTLNTFSRSGFTFSGWNTAANGSGTVYADGAAYDFTADITLFAQWTALPNHTVTFDANLGSGTMSAQTTHIPLALTLNAFSRSGYTFSGWNSAANGSGTAYADGAAYDFTADITLYAQWTALPNHTVTFDANLGSGAMSPQTTHIPSALNLNTFSRSGFTFSGWNTAANGSGTAYADGAVYDFTADITLYAQWTALPSHTVTFDANLGSGTMSPQTTHIPSALNLNTFSRSRYTFSGWNTAANGSGTAYADGATYDFTADITLYAQWTALLPALFSKSGPNNAAIDVSTEPTLSWTASSNQADYETCYDTSTSGPCTGTWTSTNNATSVKLSGLAYHTTYRWQVRAVNGSLITYANGGTPWTFTTQVIPATTTTLTVTGQPFPCEQVWTLTATVTEDSGTPTGTVTFRDGVTVLGISDLKDGVATLTISQLALGPHSITAEYSGARDFGGSLSEAVNISVHLCLMLPLFLIIE